MLKNLYLGRQTLLDLRLPRPDTGSMPASQPRCELTRLLGAGRPCPRYTRIGRHETGSAIAGRAERYRPCRRTEEEAHRVAVNAAHGRQWRPTYVGRSTSCVGAHRTLHAARTEDGVSSIGQHSSAQTW